jgi:hypothetical protein
VPGTAKEPGTWMALKGRRASLIFERGPFCCGKDLPALTRVGLTSLRFFKGQTYYAGDTTPGDFQAGARVSLRTGEPFTCPFAASASAVEFLMTYGGDVLITNARGQRTGYDPATGQMVNEIPDAHVVGFEGIHLQPSQTLRMSMSADGRQLVFDEGQATPSPQVFQAID